MIDIKTAFFSLGFASIIFAILLSLTAKKSGSERIISVLAWAKLAQGIAFFLFSGRGAILDLLSKNVGNSLLFTGFALECLAAWEFVGKVRYKKIVLPALVISILVVNAGIMVEAPEATKTAMASFIVAVLMIVCSMAFLRGKNKRSSLALTIGVMDAIVAMVNIARGATALLSVEFGLLSPHLVQYLATASFLLFIFTNGFGFLLLIKEDDDRQRKRLQSELTLREQRLNSFFRGATAGLALVDRELRYIQINDTLADLNGLPAEEHIGRSVLEVLPKLAPVVGPMLRRVLATGESVLNGEITGETPSRPGFQRHWLESFFPIPGADGTPEGVGAIVVEITALKQLEKDGFELERRLLNAEKAESLGRMAGAIAHLFNNQLGMVMGNLELALMDLSEGVSIRENLIEAIQATRRSSEISGLMLTYLGQSTRKGELLDLSEVCRQNLPMLQDAVPEGVALETDLLSPGPVVCALGNQIQQVLTNLITNSVESIGRCAGTVTLATRIIPAADIPKSHLVPIAWQPKVDVFSCLEVSDTGSGIVEDDLDKIFDPFFTTKFTGRGLGLAVVLGIVKNLGGAIGIESKMNQGSIFRVFLPVSAQTVLRQPDKAAETPETEGGTVLLVDDEEGLRRAATMMLTRLGFKVVEARDGVEAVEVFGKHQDEIRCVLLDLTMPRMNGWETLTALRALRPDLSVILASGHDEAQVMQGDHLEQPQAFLHKPYRVAALKAVLGKTLDASPD